MKKYAGRLDRRRFIRGSVVGLAGLTASRSLSGNALAEIDTKPAEKPPLIHRTLGKTGLRVPVISMGAMNAKDPFLVRAALDAGIVHIDTAWYYQFGRNEEMLGEVLKEKPRDSYVLATKVWEPRNDRTGLFPENAKPDTFFEKFETSLRRLQLDHVDILYLHNIARKEALLFEPYLEAMKKLKKEGKIRFIGVSTHQNEPEVIREAADTEVYDVVLTAYSFRQKHHAEIKKAIDYAAGAGLGIVGMKQIAGTVYNIGKEQTVNAKAALKWALQDENVHTTIPGFSTFEQLNVALSVMDNLKMTPEETTDLQEISKVAGLFCQQCGECRAQCPAGLDIPTLMRSYMYVYGYRNLSAAKEALESDHFANIPCGDCQRCSVDCAEGFDVKKKILDVARIRKVPGEFLA